MGNVKFALDTGPDASGNSWLKYIRSAPSFEEQNLAACHLTGDQVSDSGRTLAGLCVCVCVCHKAAVELFLSAGGGPYRPASAFSPSAFERTWRGVAAGAMPSRCP